ncbi:MAG TPA: hypothetical protein VEJ87_13920 [Acidimicrobiales bacterium]|nr:hypothetical protein [Acidimicrobiales bacterium]
MPNVGGTHAIAELLDLTLGQAQVLTRSIDFPAPLATMGGSKIWDLEEVRAWAGLEVYEDR